MTYEPLYVYFRPAGFVAVTWYYSPTYGLRYNDGYGYNFYYGGYGYYEYSDLDIVVKSSGPGGTVIVGDHSTRHNAASGMVAVVIILTVCIMVCLCLYICFKKSREDENEAPGKDKDFSNI